MQSVVQNHDGTKTVIALEDGALITGTIQDCTAIAERAKYMHNIGHHGSNDMRLAATVPMVMIEKYCNNNGITYQEFASGQEHKNRLLGDPALSHFRVWKGKI
jgi:hypothetical protein